MGRGWWAGREGHPAVQRSPVPVGTVLVLLARRAGHETTGPSRAVPGSERPSSHPKTVGGKVLCSTTPCFRQCLSSGFPALMEHKTTSGAQNLALSNGLSPGGALLPFRPPRPRSVGASHLASPDPVEEREAASAESFRGAVPPSQSSKTLLVFAVVFGNLLTHFFFLLR